MDSERFSIRTTTIADQTYIKRLNFITEVLGDESVNPDPDKVAKAIPFYVNAWNPDNGVIAIENKLENPAGASWMLYGTQQLHGAGFVDPEIPELAIAVENRYRGTGVGTALLQAVMDLARSQAAPGISLCVREDNPGAWRLYERLGFVRHGELQPDGYQAMLLEF